MALKWVEQFYQERQFLDCGIRWILSAFGAGKFRWLDSLLASLDRTTLRNPDAADLLERLQPDLVMTTHMFGPEMDLLAEAKRRRIPTLGVVKSWDNLTSKTRMRVKPDRLLVWSPMMRDEAISLHHVDPSTIHVVGAPQFDQYAKSHPSESREVFWNRHGVDSSMKIILYSPGVKFTISDHENLRLLHEIINSPDFPFKCHVHVRQYPKKPQDFSELERSLGITSENAGRVVLSWEDSVDQTQEEVDYLHLLMTHVDVLVQFGSTIALDACCTDTPIIGYNLDRHDSRRPARSMRARHHECTHNLYPLLYRGVRLVQTREQLRLALIRYLRSPDADSSGRRAMLHRLAWNIDGKAKDRIAKHVLEMSRKRAERV